MIAKKKKQQKTLNSFEQNAASESATPYMCRPGRTPSSFVTVPMLQSEERFFRDQPRITTKNLRQRCYYAGAALFSHATGNFAKPSSPAEREIKYKSTQYCTNANSKVVIVKIKK